jgi:uncharacterized phage protein gp47/JayE
MQWLVLLVLQTTRAATSRDADLDSWMADFSVTRLPAVAATGSVTFSRISPGMVSLIRPGVLARTADGTQTFQVSVDTTNAAWAPANNGYMLAAGVAAVSVPVIAQTRGAAGNVLAGAITLLASAMPGVDSVTNITAFQNGVDAESDSALRTRFQNFIASRSRATPLAVGYAISSIQQGLSYTIQENVDASGQSHVGSFLVTVDDGSGNPSSALLSTVQQAVDAVRPIGSIFAIQPPAVTTANVSLTLTVAATASKPQVVALVGAALSQYINGLAIGMTLPLTKLAQIAYAASPDVMNVGQLLVNSSTGDVTPSASGVVKAGVVAVS